MLMAKYRLEWNLVVHKVSFFIITVLCFYLFAGGLSAILPRDYRVGVVAYRDEVCISQPPGSSHEMIENALREIEYANYGNAGAGLSAAVEENNNGICSES